MIQIVLRRVHLGNQSISAEIDIVEKLFAQKLLCPGFHAGPAIPQGELILNILLQGLHIRAVQHAGNRQLRHLGQGAVLHIRALPIRQNGLPDHQSTQEEAEENRYKAGISFCHGVSLLRTGNTGTDYSCRPPDRQCKQPGPPASKWG